jgi:dTDP-4-amino-4,6-dideoxygalactose transaminase
MTSPVAFNVPQLAGNELECITDALHRQHISGDGHYTKLAQKSLTAALGTPALLTTSCTHALEMAALLLGLEPGDEFIVPSFTFVTTASAFALRGARPVFADIRPDTLNLDETRLEALITPRTRAIVPVHYAGVGCEMEAILAIAAKHGIPVVEDNAHGLFGKYKGRWLGTMGSLATQSFHETKNISCGEGGALLINDPQLHEMAEIIREKGTNRARFFRGQVDKYSWVALGSSYVMSDLLAAYLHVQLQHAAEIQSKRQAIWQRYDAELKGWATSHGIRQPIIPEHCEQAWHMYYLLLPSLDARTALISYLKSLQISAVFHYLPLHLSECAAQWGSAEAECPVTLEVSDRLLRLPFHTGMAAADQARVIEALLAWSPPA